MFKRLMNLSEKITHKQVQEICERNNAVAHPKVRIADILPIEGSGIPNNLFSFALTSHFDVIVTDHEEYPLFAVEFDGVQHILDPKQIERDKKKDALCERFDLPLLRITTEYLNDDYRQMNLLGWFIETWFAYQWFQQAKDNGELDYYEPFMPVSFSSIQGNENEYPLWLSRNVRGRIFQLYGQGVVGDMIPACYVWYDKENNEYHSVAWVVIDENTAVLATANMKVQSFHVPIPDILEDLTLLQLDTDLTEILHNKLSPVPHEVVNETITQMEAKYGNVVFGGSGNSSPKIKI